MRTNGTGKLDKHSRQAGDFLLSCLYKLEARTFSLSPDSASLIEEMAAKLCVTWDWIMGMGGWRKGEHLRDTGELSGMDEGECWVGGVAGKASGRG